MSAPLHVLVVDDSAVVRQAMTTILEKAAGARVTVAADPLIAMRKMAQARPDVILLDLEMPRMDGISFLRKLMAEDPIPVVVCSGKAGAGTQAALAAMEEGAVAVVAKPRLGIREFLEDSAILLEESLRGAAAARLRPVRPRMRIGAAVAPAPAQPKPGLLAAPRGHQRMLALAASTGGTEALRTILEELPPDAPGAVVVQHMPEGFTRAFADRLNAGCRIEVKEAEAGDRVREGRALIAPGNRHTSVARDADGFFVEVYDGPLVSRHRPSADVLFRSVAAAAGRDAVGAILTGMGADGAPGLLAMSRAGAATIAQDEASSVVFGMPKEAIALGAASEVLPLAAIAQALLRLAHQAPERTP